MSILSLVTALKTQAVVIGATLLVGGVAIGMATTGSPNPIVWGVHLVNSNGPGGSTGAPSTSTESSPEPTASPEPTNMAEPAQTPETSANPEPKETSSPTKSEGESGDD
ncbi:MAG: hypothetical protein ACYDAL_11445 [Candidatus Dormibacteraceae bacterium]